MSTCISQLLAESGRLASRRSVSAAHAEGGRPWLVATSSCGRRARLCPPRLIHSSLAETTMKKINTNMIEELTWASPKGKFTGAGKDVSESLGWDPHSPEPKNRHPFAVEILRISPGQTPYPYHSHAAQWEFYHVISGRGLARDEEGKTRIEAGDAFIFAPGESHQFINDSSEDLVLYVIADNPIGESCYYPDSQKWLVRSPERRLLGSGELDYYDGEE
jgi:mannose-6-phosphate isomerase-like protein (cupin superfamily)